MNTYCKLTIALMSALFMVCSLSGYLTGQTSPADGTSTSGESNTFKTISPANTWTDMTYDPMMGGNVHSRRYRFSEDSVEVGDNWYFQLQISQSKEGDEWSDLDLYREENGVIYVNSHEVEYVVMDFNVEAGETFSIEPPPGGSIVDFLVVSVDSIELLDGSLRKRIGLGCYEFEEVSYYWVEGIGSLNQTLGLYHCFFDVADDPILCFYQNGEMIYSNEDNDECWITSVTDIHEHGINIYPNPASDFLTIEFDDPPAQDIEFVVFEYTGKRIRNFQFSGFQSQYQLQISELSPGFYYLSWEENGRPYVYHFVVAD